MENAIDNQKITFKIAGNELQKEEGYNLRFILESLSSFETLLDKTYLHFENKSRMSENDKENLSIRLVEVREGSFIADLVIQMRDLALPIAPLVAENSEHIWNAVKTSYSYIKTVLKAREEGKEVELNMDNTQQGIQVVNTGSGNVTININPEIPPLASKLAPTFSDMAKKVDGENVSSIQFSSEDHVEVTFTEEEKVLFKKRNYLDETVFELSGKITGSYFSSLSGQIQILENQHGIPAGVYRFKATENFRDEDQWKSMYLEEKRYSCQKRISLDPTKGFEEKVEELQILAVIDDV